MRVPTTIFGQHVWYRNEPEYERRYVDARPRRNRSRRAKGGESR